MRSPLRAHRRLRSDPHVRARHSARPGRQVHLAPLRDAGRDRARARPEITHLAPGADVAATIACLRALGVADRRGRARLDVARPRPRLGGLRAPAGVARRGNSGTTMRLLAGLLAGRPVPVTITGDASLRRRPMRRVIEPLTAMGARIGSRRRPGAARSSTAARSRASTGGRPVASAQVKSAIMLAGLSAPGRTTVHRAAGDTRSLRSARFRRSASQCDRSDGLSVTRPRAARRRRRRRPACSRCRATRRRRPSGPRRPRRCPGRRSDSTGVCLNPRRLGFIGALERMGAEITIDVDGRGRRRAGRPHRGRARRPRHAR